MIKLLESITTDENDVSQQVYDGAAMNFQACAQRNGYIFGCTLTTENKRISISSGLLLIRGYRLSIDETTVLLDLSSAPLHAIASTYYLFIRIERTGDNATWSARYQSMLGNRNNAAIEQVDGIYDYPVASFVASASGISSISRIMSKIPASSSSGSTTVIGGLPTPQIAIVHDGFLANPYYGYLILANRADYLKYANTYEVSLVLYRYLAKGRSCKSMGATRIRYGKSGYVKVVHTTGSNLGWSTSENEPFRLSVLVNENDNDVGLKNAVIVDKDGITYARNDIIESLTSYARGMFYDPGQSYDSNRNCMIPGKNRNVVTGYSNPYFIRCTRSKKGWNGKGFASNWAGPYGKWHKYNEFRFAYAIEVRDAANSLVATSPLSAPVSIKPNYSRSVSIGDYTNKPYVNNESELFRIRIG